MQYCEDCKHYGIDEYHAEEKQDRFSRCLARPKENIKFITRTPNLDDHEFCSSVRTGFTCSEFSQKPPATAEGTINE